MYSIHHVIVNMNDVHNKLKELLPFNFTPQTVKEVIDNAKKSIAISMYIINLNENYKKSQVYKLCNSLVEAKKRGVDVKIILDQNIDFVRAGKASTWEIEGKNEDAYKYFKKNGIDVFYDDKTTYMHSKAIVVDEEIVITMADGREYSKKGS